MECICPNPTSWYEVYERLAKYAQLNPCAPPSPPKPLILAGWAYTNDIEKKQRWQDTVAWSEKNGCSHIVSGIPDSDFYFVYEPTSYEVGSLGGPMYRPWDFEEKKPLPSEILEQFLDILVTC